MHVTDVRADLLAEQAALDDVVSALSDDQFALATPSPGWSVADQIGHLAYYDNAAAVAIADPEGFQAMMDGLVGRLGSAESSDDFVLGPFRAMAPPELVQAWRDNRATLAAASASLADDDRVVWYGPSMGSKSFLTARIMEAWAHGQDIVDAVGVTRPATDRLRHIAQLGFITRGWSYVNRGLEPRTESVRVELTAPSGATWRFGPDDAAESVMGSAEDFCLVVTQRRSVAATDLAVEGDAALDWMQKAQAFAGPATDGPS